MNPFAPNDGTPLVIRFGPEAVIAERHRLCKRISTKKITVQIDNVFSVYLFFNFVALTENFDNPYTNLDSFPSIGTPEMKALLP